MRKKNKVVIIIPARYGSSRYKGKPLVKILGKELVLRVADSCSKVLGKKYLYIATDDKRIANVIKKNGFNFIMTSKNCLTGTDRVAEASKKINANIFINVQGDEPLVSKKDINSIIDAKRKNPNHVICGYSAINKIQNPKDLNIPKVVMNSKNELIYISRSLVPGSKKTVKVKKYYKQVCIYAFNSSELNKFYKMKKKSDLESSEDIEILRFYELGVKIKMVRVSDTVAVDEISDVKKVERLILKDK